MLNTLFRHHPIQVHAAHTASSLAAAPTAELAEEHGFIRHPEGFPLSLLPIKPNHSQNSHTSSLRNNDGVGLLVSLEKKLPLGSEFIIQIPLRNEEYTFQAKLVFLKKLETSFEAGLCLHEQEDLIQLRVIEQICRMEHYLHQMKQLEESVVDINNHSVLAA